MKLIKAKDRNLQLIDKLLEVWESSVRATHNFLSNEEKKKKKNMYQKH